MLWAGPQYVLSLYFREAEWILHKSSGVTLECGISCAVEHGPMPGQQSGQENRKRKEVLL